MSPFEVVAVIIAIFFAVGIVVGIMLVAAMSRDGRPREFHPNSREPGVGPPAEPDDRDDYHWWANGR